MFRKCGSSLHQSIKVKNGSRSQVADVEADVANHANQYGNLQLTPPFH
jgi:hypothetical protein